MLSDDVTGMFGVEPGCPTHGDEHMRECSMCGTEFCRRCFPRSAVCPDCADQTDEDEEEEPDFDDVSNLGEVLEDDEEAEKRVSESEDETPPPGGALDDDSRERY